MTGLNGSVPQAPGDHTLLLIVPAVLKETVDPMIIRPKTNEFFCIANTFY